MKISKIIFFLIIVILSIDVQSQELSKNEKKVIDIIDKNNDDAIDLLEKIVNINSGTLNSSGVKKVGDILASEFESIGFKANWISMPEEVNRAGHLFCEINTGNVKGKKLLLIGHLDTVFEEDSPFQEFKREGNTVYGPGVDDMKGGNIIIYAALKSLYEAGLLKNTQIIVAYTGDEESVGDPVNISRRDLIEASKRSDIALGFEGSSGLNYATVARRSSGSWVLKTSGVGAHSSGIFTEKVGAGAIFEMSRILSSFYNELQEKNLTFNPSMVVGGTSLSFEEKQSKGFAYGKSNIVPQETIVQGDIRCLSNEQIESTVNKMKEIVSSNNLPQTKASISFDLKYPSMKPTPGNYAVLSVLDGVSKDLNQGAVAAYDPGKRGAGDISFVADNLDCLDGLGTMGSGSHTTNENMDLTYFKDLTKRAALLIYRLINTKS